MNLNISDLILDNLPYSIWVKDKSKKYIYANTEFCKTINKPRSEILNKNDFDLFDYETALFYNSTDSYTSNQNSTQTFINKTDNLIRECYKKILYHNEEIIGILGSFIDVTEKYNYQNELSHQKEFLQAIFDNIPDHIFFKDLNSVYLGCNKPCTEVFEFDSVDDIVGKTDYDLHPNKEMVSKFLERDKIIMETRIKEVSHVTIKSKDGSEHYAENIKAPIILKDNSVVGIVGISRDISYRKNLEDKLYKLSYVDTLTNLYNRTYFINRSDALFKEEYLPLSIIMGDINGLKIINDSLGHLEGDKLIANISNIISSCCRDTDYVFRWGGDEIVILLPNTESQIANKIMHDIYDKCSESSTPENLLSIALGNSTITSLNSSIECGLKEAEDKVYRHKLIQTESFRSSLLETLQRSLFEKSEETEHHTERLQDLGIKLGELLNLQASDIDDIILVCNLHDIGKIGIHEDILKKPSELTQDEFEIMKLHCEKGYRITQGMPELHHVSKAILTHHERYDGTGYPLGLKNDEIPLVSRIVAVVDAYDAMTNDRIYRKKLSKEQAINQLLINSGTQFDPFIVEKFLLLL